MTAISGGVVDVDIAVGVVAVGLCSFKRWRCCRRRCAGFRVALV